MTGYIQWHASQEFKPGDVALNGGLLWRHDGKAFRIIGDSDDLLPICGTCGQSAQPNVLKEHQHRCAGAETERVDVSIISAAQEMLATLEDWMAVDSMMAFLEVRLRTRDAIAKAKGEDGGG